MKAVNLIPHDQRRGAGGLAGRSGGIVYVVVGGLAAVVALGVVYAFAVKSVADRTGQLGQVTDEVGAVQAQAAALQPYVQVGELRQSAVSSVVALAENRFDWPDAMQQLALALPSDVTLTTVSASAGMLTPSSGVGPSTTTATGDGAGFSIAGCASSQAEVATVLIALAHVPGVDSVQLGNATKIGKVVPNASKPVARAKALAVQGQCPLVSFTMVLSYASNYALPNTKVTAARPSGAQTLSSTFQHASKQGARTGR